MTFTAIVPGANPGEAKMCLRLIAELTHVPLAIAILIVLYPDHNVRTIVLIFTATKLPNDKLIRKQQ